MFTGQEGTSKEWIWKAEWIPYIATNLSNPISSEA